MQQANLAQYSKKLTRVTVCLLIAAVGFSVLSGGKASALSGSDFNAGRIIDDGVFYNQSTMNPQQIQQFLNARVPVCDTNGEKMINSTQTRAQWAAANGKPLPPYICLKDYSQSVPTITNGGSDLCTGSIAGGTKSAAQIIFEVSQACGVNPQVLIVLLQKEQSLVTDDWPWPIQYRSATGYGCPDTAPCDAEFYGFFNQVYQAAKAYKRYRANPNNYNYRANRNNTILWHPNHACGTSTVFIENQATAGLYIYTPYRPNQAALNNLYGLGDGCSSYGNRNFWRLFSDWFGSTQTDVPYAWIFEGIDAHYDATRTSASIVTSRITVKPSEKVYLTVRARNIGNETWTPSYIRFGTWGPADRQSIFYDPSWHVQTRSALLAESSVSPGQIGTFRFALTAPSSTGSYKEYFNVVAEGRQWLNDIGFHLRINVVESVLPSNSSDTNLTSGKVLLTGQHLLSPDRQSALSLQKDGNLVFYRNFKAVWQSKTAGHASDKLVMQADGNLVLYDKNNVALWNTGTPGNSGAYLTTQTDGNLVLYSPTGSPLWTTNTPHRPNLLGYVNTDISSTRLFQGQQIETANRKYRLLLQGDGNLVLYSGSKALWATYTFDDNRPYLAMQGDGNLVLYSADGKPLWFSSTAGNAGSRLVIQADGNLVMYSSSNKPIWDTSTKGQ